MDAMPPLINLLGILEVILLTIVDIGALVYAVLASLVDLATTLGSNFTAIWKQFGDIIGLSLKMADVNAAAIKGSKAAVDPLRKAADTVGNWTGSAQGGTTSAPATPGTPGTSPQAMGPTGPGTQYIAFDLNLAPGIHQVVALKIDENGKQTMIRNETRGAGLGYGLA